MCAAHSKEPAPSSGLDAPHVVEVGAGVFKDTCLSLLDQVNRREFEVVVTKYGAPVARVVPDGGHMPSAHGFMRGTVLDQADIVSPDFEAWGDVG
jgi:antitoxin (DNA-binding transcriptional repressor) of toxin-antitoxin stability system